MLLLSSCESGNDISTEAESGDLAGTENEQTETDVTPTEPVTDEQTVADTETEVGTENETNEPDTETESETEEETTRRVLEWETYEPALDNSKVNTSVTPVVKPTTWVATDGLDRVLPTHTDTGDVREDKLVAAFYWTWHGDFGNQQTAYNNAQNLKILDDNGYAESDYWSLSGSELKKMGVYTADNAYHFWDEPVYGYYDGDDEWVIRKQAELLASAGVDVVFFDNTNGAFTWLETALHVMKVFSEAREQGVKAPYVSFLLPFGPTDGARTQIISLYHEIYEKGLYEDVWFMLDGKPMLMGYQTCLSTSNDEQKTIRDYFTWRNNIGGYTDSESARNQWGWLSVYPQAYYHNDKGEIEQTTVGVAVNHNYVKHVISAMNYENTIGRTWTSRGIDTRPNAVYYGANFAQQWENAIALDPKIVFVTGWNEWVAMKLKHWTGDYYNCFVDQYCPEYSRDCEPSNGILKDYYYYQLASYIRQYKGTEEIEAASPEKLIDVNGGYGQWANVSPRYTDYIGLPDRDATGYRNPATGKKYQYTNTTGRNDIYDCKVARDYENLYFMVRTVDTLTPYTDPDWMHLYLDMGDSTENWEHYEYVINKNTPTETEAYLEKFVGNGYESVIIGKVNYKVTDNVLVICVPKTLIGIDKDTLDFTLDFKWTDNTGVDAVTGEYEDGNIMLWYSNGDCAPVGRYNYRYTTSSPEPYTNTEKNYGYIHLDFTDKEQLKEFDKYILGDVVGMEYQLTDDGIVLKVTKADAPSFTFDYSKGMVSIPADVYKVIRIDYVTSDIKAAKITPTGGKNSKGKASSVSFDVDGELHTCILDLSSSRVWSDGYAKSLIIKPENAKVGNTITIKAISFLKQAPDAE